MPLLNTIKADETLAPFLSDECCENNICAEVEEGLSIEDYLVIKVDDYYNSLGLGDTPPSPDCLFVVRCDEDEYALNIVELKKTGKTSSFKIDNLIGKFETCLSDFMSLKFGEYFDRDFKDIHLFFVSKIPLFPNSQAMKGRKMRILTRRPLEFREKVYFIDPRNPEPMITPCN